jgi:hypothetical protein
LFLGPQTFIVIFLIIFTCATSSFYTRTERRGKELAPGETERQRERESMRETERQRVAGVGILSKNGHWKND